MKKMRNYWVIGFLIYKHVCMYICAHIFGYLFTGIKTYYIHIYIHTYKSEISKIRLTKLAFNNFNVLQTTSNIQIYKLQ